MNESITAFLLLLQGFMCSLAATALPYLTVNSLTPRSLVVLRELLLNYVSVASSIQTKGKVSAEYPVHIQIFSIFFSS